MSPQDRPGDPETVLSQALRAMAGAAREAPAREQPAPGGRRRLTAGQVLLLAVLLGLVVGVTAGIVSLLA
ncbi:hypothetical protein [Nakamurella endophytica]|uniref:Uncharacterized protein n=1 Tax=Nakamurella endophytica TaxID=1748367 RepID=A0A917WIA3_9ACTN|nr:hypothetical protein [Nakamurella endophytica]GGM08506.1 hypothetical protein GCM10011594_30530 [Nakamurella endophytica]